MIQNHRRSTRHTQAYYYGDDLTELPHDVEIDGVPEAPYDEIDGIPEAPSDCNGETLVDQCDLRHEALPEKCNGLTELSQNVKIDKVPKTPHDEIDGVIKAPTYSDVEIEQPDGGHGAPHNKNDGPTGVNSAVLHLQTLQSTDCEILMKETQPKDLISEKEHDDVSDPGVDENNNDEDELQCPKCLKSFGVLKHLELLDHINTCV